MAITAPDLDTHQERPDNGLSLIPSDPWSADWSPPTSSDVASRHQSVQRHQQDGWIPSQGASQHRAGDATTPAKFPSAKRRPKPNKIVVHHSKRSRRGQRSGRRLGAIRIAIATTAITLAFTAVAAAYWYLAALNG